MKKRKIISAILALVMVFSLVGTFEISALAADPITIDAMPGEIVWSENFDKAENDGKTLTELGFTENDKSVNLVADFIVDTAAKEENASNKALKGGVRIARMYVSAEEQAEIDKSEYKVGDKNADLVQYGENYFLITNEGGRMWTAADSEGNVIAEKTNSRRYWFYADGTPYTYKEVDKYTNLSVGEAAQSSVIIPSFSNFKSVGGNVVGLYSVGFKIMNPRTENWSGEDGATIVVPSGQTGQFYFRDSIIRVDKNHVLEYNGDAENVYIPEGASSYLGITPDVDGRLTTTDNLVSFSKTKRTGGTWHDVLIMLDYDNGYYKLYYDGLPVYFLASDKASYTNQFEMNLKNNIPAISLTTPRLNLFSGNEPYFDDFVSKYDGETLESKLTWDTISNGQIIASVVGDLKLPKKITYKGQELDIVWTTSNADAITNEGVVKRATVNASAVLTASVGGKELKFNITVKGTDGKPTIYLAGDSHMCDYATSSYPQQGWGYYFKTLFGDNATVVNTAQGGRSAKSFYIDPSRFKRAIKEKLLPGDFVIISFGTNDAAQANNPNYVFSYTDEEGVLHQNVMVGSQIPEYKEYLQKYIDEIREKGAYPIFVTMANSTYNYDTYSTYVDAMREVAGINNVDLVDLNRAHNDHIKYVKSLDCTPEAEKLGKIVPEFVKNEIMMYNMLQNYGVDKNDDAYHFTVKGARTLSRWVEQGIYNGEGATLKALKELMVPELVQPTIYTAGDSLMFDWTRFGQKWYPYQGWGSYLYQYFEKANVNNTAYSGETTASFYYLPQYMPTVRPLLNHGDYLILSLGVNDMGYANNTDPVKGFITGYDGKVYKKGADLSEYAVNLKMYIEDMRKRGVNIVFATFPTWGGTYDYGANYIAKMKEVATANNIPVIDLRAKNLEYIDTYQDGLVAGDALPTAYKNDMHMTKNTMKNDFGFTDETVASHPSSMLGTTGDYTHFNINGAKTITRLAMEALLESADPKLDELQSYVDLDALDEKELTNSELVLTNVQFIGAPGQKGYVGAAISATLPKGKLSRMKWVFVTPTERLYSNTIVKTPAVDVEGSVKFGLSIENGTVGTDGKLGTTKKITGVDAIFRVDGTDVFTNLLDKANFVR